MQLSGFQSLKSIAMKTRLLLSFLFCLPFCLLYSQVPQGFNYQAIARDGATPIITTIKVRITIQSDSINPATTFWIEEHSSVSPNNFGLFTLVIGSGERQSGSTVDKFGNIDWTVLPKYIKTEIDYNGWKTMGSSRLWTVPYSMVTDLSRVNKLKVTGPPLFSDDSALFEVKNKDKKTVFAVYNDGVRIYVNEPNKGAKGGFAIGGFNTKKGDLGQDYFIVDPNRIRMYIDTNTVGKGAKGGFAIGGFSTGKGSIQDYLRITNDTTRFFINDNPKTKSAKGGFAIGGFGVSKSDVNFLNITPDSTRILTKDPNAGFAVQDLSGNGESYLHIKPENMFIGKEAGKKTVGLYNSFFGYQSGLNNNTGAYNVFIGYQSGLTNTLGGSNIFLGPQSGYKNTQGAYNVFIGHNSGYTNEAGHDNVFVGQRSGYSNLSGNANLFVGQNSGENNYTGTHNVFLGYETGKFNTTGIHNVYLGTQAGFSDNVGNNNVFLGNQAGFNETGSDKLYIENSVAGKPDALIYGDFNSNELRLNAKVGVNSDNSGYSLNVAGDINLNGKIYQNGASYSGLDKAELTENLSSPLPYNNPSVGTLIYNTGTKQPKGFFYWDGTRWLRLVASAAPSVVCQSVTNILGTSVTANANISDDGGTSVVTRGFCWNTSANPAIDGSHSLDGNGTGTFSTNITGLLNNTDYHVRAYAQNQAGIAYSNDVPFNTGNPVTLPVLSTAGVTNVTGITASSGGTITSDGGASVTARGVCWSSSGTPTTANSKTTDGAGAGTFTSSLISLSMGVTYYVRAYATNVIGTAYGDQYQFTTPMLPVVSTAAVTSLTATGATSGGNITSAGGGEITHRGVCWSHTNSTPGLSDSKTDDGTGAGIFSSSIVGLTENTSYYIRAYATNAAGTSFGDVITFITLTLPVTDIDGNVYNTIGIGTQIWMKENLKTTKLNDGTAIPNVTTWGEWAGLSTPAYCWYNNDSPSYKNIYGALYNWHTVNTNKLCPSGWHVPSHDEWTVLESYLGGSALAGGKLKEAGIVHWTSPNTGATNESGFTALPGGFRYGSDAFMQGEGRWWSSTLWSSDAAWELFLLNDSSASTIGVTPMILGGSVRCVKN